MYHFDRYAQMQAEAWAYDQPYVPPEDALSSSLQSSTLFPSMFTGFDSPEPSESGSSRSSLDFAPDMAPYHGAASIPTDASYVLGGLSMSDTLHDREYDTNQSLMFDFSNFDMPYIPAPEHLPAHGLYSVAAQSPPTLSIPLAPEPSLPSTPVPATPTPCHAPQTIYTPAPMTSASITSPASPFSNDSDSDANDGEYRPAGARKARRRAARTSPYPSPSPSPASSPRSPSSPSARRSTSIRPRNTQVAATRTDTHAGQCPHCDYVQTNGRAPDLARHIASHLAGQDPMKWVCCGVPLAHARAYGVRMGPGAEVNMYEGVPMVGGCWRTFTRRDALGRHLRQQECCVGDVNAPWLRGNMERSEKKRAR
ncbi:hypothetical protein CERSUDRAFT_122066, partial [Gelatoporia subvermispora B]